MYYLYNPYSLSGKKERKYYTLENLKDFWKEECVCQEWWPVYKILNNSFKIVDFNSENEAKYEVLKIENNIIDRSE